MKSPVSSTVSKCSTHAGSYLPLIVLYHLIISPLYRLYSSVGKFTNLSHSHCMAFQIALELISWLSSAVKYQGVDRKIREMSEDNVDF